MKAVKINATKVKQSLEEFGSLAKAVEALKSEKQALTEEIIQSKKERQVLSQARRKLQADTDQLNRQLSQEKKNLQSLADRYGKWERQYNLFQGFLAMLLGSPSVSTSIENLVSLLQELVQSSWAVSKSPDELRGYFVRTVMGDYLKFFRC